MAKKVCKKCQLFVEGAVCPICKGSNFSENWKGRVYIVNPEKSSIAKRMEITVKGEYAVKIR